jgi:hypothetical protein
MSDALAETGDATAALRALEDLRAQAAGALAD